MKRCYISVCVVLISPRVGPCRIRYEHEVVLNVKPITNVIQWTLQTKGLEFHYQPALTAKEIADGEVRPDDIVGSYAVYHSTKQGNYAGGKNYRAGKAFHIKRPKITDASGNWVWGDLNIDVAAQLMTVTVPQAFLNSAVYPVIVDPTFGYTTAGGTQQFHGADYVVGSLYTSSEAGDITKLTVSGYQSGTNVKALVFDNTYALLTNGVGGTGVLPLTQGWVDMTYSTSPSVTAADFGLGVICDGGNHIYYDSGATNQGFQMAGNSYASPTDLSGETLVAKKFSVYATYTASGGSGASVTLTGQSGTADIGSLSISGTANTDLSGLSGTGNVGSFIISGSAAITLSGVSGTGQVGSLNISTAGDVSVSLSGVSGTGNIGSLSISGTANLTLTGVSGTGQIGTLSAGNSVNVALSGISGTAQVGSLSVAINQALTLAGVSGTGQVGILDITGNANISITGQSATANIGSLSVDTGIPSIVVAGFRIMTIEHQDRTYLIVAEDTTATIEKDPTIH